MSCGGGLLLVRAFGSPLRLACFAPSFLSRFFFKAADAGARPPFSSRGGRPFPFCILRSVDTHIFQWCVLLVVRWLGLASLSGRSEDFSSLPFSLVALPPSLSLCRNVVGAASPLRPSDMVAKELVVGREVVRRGRRTT